MSKWHGNQFPYLWKLHAFKLILEEYLSHQTETVLFLHEKSAA